MFASRPTSHYPGGAAKPSQLTGLNELQHFASLGRLSASLLHEMSHPLTVASLQLEAFGDTPDPGMRRIRQSVSQMRTYIEAARQQLAQDGSHVRFRIADQLTHIRQIIMPLAQMKHVAIQFEDPPTCELLGDPLKFQHILCNLLVNALDAYPGEVSSHPRLVRLSFRLSNSEVLISVTDWGKGIQRRHMAQIFQPFYSTQTKASRGLGIGLSIVHEYVTTDFKGSISVASTRRHGTQFRIRLPIASSRSAG